MANPQRFREFIEEIAQGNIKWQYDDGTERVIRRIGMNTDAKSFLQYLEALENAQDTSVSSKIIAKCREEIEWVDSCFADMESGTKYAEEDNTYLPGWRKAHQQILDIIKEK